MTKTLHYLYLGENGTILSPVKLPDVYHVKQYKLVADANRALTKDGINTYPYVVVPESEVDLWYEVNGQD